MILYEDLTAGMFTGCSQNMSLVTRAIRSHLVGFLIFLDSFVSMRYKSNPIPQIPTPQANSSLHHDKSGRQLCCHIRHADNHHQPNVSSFRQHNPTEYVIVGLSLQRRLTRPCAYAHARRVKLNKGTKFAVQLTICCNGVG